MRRLDVNKIRECVRETCLELATYINEDVEKALKQSVANENGLGLKVLEMLINNGVIAKEKNLPLCQDTGIVFVALEYGQEVIFENGSVEKAINEGVKEAYDGGFLRKSVVEDPFFRKNTGDNTPAMIHYELVEGNEVVLKVMLKGFGSENMSKTKMLKPSDGIQGVRDFVKECITTAGGNPCPPTVIGVGIGGTLDRATHLSKIALFRKIGERNDKEHLAKLEEELLEQLNDTNVGPMGFGGKTTALEVFVETAPTHIAGLPVAVNVNCHSLRRKTIKL
ncbi:MAG: fumarate hydratase [Filifactoraceae bacterium]